MYPKVRMRAVFSAFGSICSCSSQKTLDFSVVQVAKASPFSPWTATILKHAVSKSLRFSSWVAYSTVG